MKLPEKIKGRNRIRDGRIVSLWALENWSAEKIAEKFNLTQRRVEQILYDNHDFVKLDREWEQKKRVHRLRQILKTAPKSQRDEVEIMQEFRKEIDGDDDKSRGRGDTHIIVIRDGESKSIGSQTQKISGQVSIQRA